VHPDQFVSIRNMLYGMPASYIGKTVQVRSTRTFIELFHQHLAVRRDAIPSSRTAYLADDFPAHAETFKP